MDRWGQTGKPPWRVLAVDDEALVGKAFGRCLAAWGLDVVVHTDVWRGLQVSPPPDLLELGLVLEKPVGCQALVDAVLGLLSGRA